MLTKSPTSELQDTIVADGRRLRHLPLDARVRLAAGLVTGNQRSRFSRKAACEACGVPWHLVRQAVNGKPGPSRASAIAVSWWQQASPGDRVEFVAACGVSEVWDALAEVVS